MKIARIILLFCGLITGLYCAGQLGSVDYAQLNYLNEVDNTLMINSKEGVKVELLPFEISNGDNEILSLKDYTIKHKIPYTGREQIILAKPQVIPLLDAYSINAIRFEHKRKVYTIFLLQYHYITQSGIKKVLVDSNFDYHLDVSSDLNIKSGEPIELTYSPLNVSFSFKSPNVFVDKTKKAYQINLKKRQLDKFKKANDYQLWAVKNKLFVPFVNTELNIHNAGVSKYSISGPSENRSYQWKYNGGSFTVLAGVLLNKKNGIYIKGSSLRIEPGDYTINYERQSGTIQDHHQSNAFLPRVELNYGVGVLHKIFMSQNLSGNFGLEYLWYNYPNSEFNDLLSGRNILSPKIMIEYHHSKSISYYFGVDMRYYNFLLNEQGVRYFERRFHQDYNFNQSNQRNLSFNLGLSYGI